MAIGNTDYWGYGLIPVEWLGINGLDGEDEGQVDDYDGSAFDPYAYAEHLKEIEAEATRQANEFQIASANALNKFNAKEAEKQRAWQDQQNSRAMLFESAEAEKSRQWQEMMSSTAYQRAMNDMKSAGLNPILAYQQGGASTTTGATASGFATGGASAQGAMATGHKASYSKENIAMQFLTLMLSSALDVVGKFIPGKK